MFRNTMKAIALAAAVAIISIPSAGALDVDKLTFPPLGRIDIPEVERVELPNGMVLMLVEDHELPLVNFRALVRAGEIYGTEGKRALTGVFGEVQRTGGTKSMTGDEIDEVLENIGASVETGLGTESGSVSAQCLNDQVDTVLPIFADVLMNPEFRQDKIDLAKTQLRSAISRRNDQPFQIMSREFGKLMYGPDSPYANEPEYDDVSALTREDLLAYHAEFYHPNTVILGVWGDFDSADMKARIERAFASWPKADIAYPAKPQVSQFTPGSIHYIEKTDIEQSFILTGHLSVRWDNPDLPKIRLMNEILGGGFSSRMFKKVRTEKGLAYATGGQINPAYDHPGIFYAFSTTKHATANETLNTMLEVIETLQRGGATEEELAIAKEGYLNSFVFSFDSTGEVVNRLMNYEYFGYPADFLQKFRKKIEAVTVADIQQVARDYIRRDDLIMLVIGDSSRFDEPLTSFGPVAEIDITIPEPTSQEVVAAATPASLARGREIAEKAINAVGGLAPAREVKTLEASTSITMKTPGGEFELIGTQTVVYPDRVRYELNAPFGKVIQVLDGESGWMSSPQGVQPMPEAQATQMRKEMRFNWIQLVRLLSSDDVRIQSLGSIQFESRTAEDILITLADGTTAHLYVAADDMTPLGIKRMGTTPQGPAEVVTLLGDFRDVGAVQLPFSVVSKTGGEVYQTIRISEAKVNHEVDEEIFKKPEN